MPRTVTLTINLDDSFGEIDFKDGEDIYNLLDFTMLHMEDEPFGGTLRDGGYSAGAPVGTYSILTNDDINKSNGNP